MGWGSATELFDGAVDVALEFAPGVREPARSLIIRAVVERMYTAVDWADWDTQDESRYFNDHLVHVMWTRGEVDEDYYAEFLDR